MRDFDQEMKQSQLRWRNDNVKNSEQGRQNGVNREWILPSNVWERGLWQGIRSDKPYSVAGYLEANNVGRHAGSHNLKSSWISGVNLYFPFGSSPDGRRMLASFLNRHVDKRVESVDSIELEYAEIDELSPGQLLGEKDGSRGSGQTSPDLGFPVVLSDNYFSRPTTTKTPVVPI